MVEGELLTSALQGALTDSSGGSGDLASAEAVSDSSIMASTPPG